MILPQICKYLTNYLTMIQFQPPLRSSSGMLVHHRHHWRLELALASVMTSSLGQQSTMPVMIDEGMSVVVVMVHLCRRCAIVTIVFADGGQSGCCRPCDLPMAVVELVVVGHVAGASRRYLVRASHRSTRKDAHALVPEYWWRWNVYLRL